MRHEELSRFRNDLLIALSLLTRLPVPDPIWEDKVHTHAAAAWAYPLAGAAVALPAMILAGMGPRLSLPSEVTALLVIAVLILLTGAMHEDGLADTADGFWGGWEPARRLEIMKDSAIGSYGVLALLVVIGTQWAALSTLIASDHVFFVLLLSAMISRAAMGFAMYGLPPARRDGLSHRTGQPDTGALMISTAMCLIGSFVFAPFALVLLWAVISFGTTAAMMRLARHKISGQTGDVLGAIQLLTQAALWVAAAAYFATS